MRGLRFEWIGERARQVRQGVDRGLALAGRQARSGRGRARGVADRLRGGHARADVADDVLADRIRSSLGPLERRLDIPRVHVMVQHHVALLHGDVATRADRDAVVAAVAAVPGVRGVDDFLHIGLLPGDTRPSSARTLRPPTAGRGRVADLASTSLAYVPADGTLRDVARRLATVDVGALVIGSEHAATGVVSERDVSRALADDADPDEVWAADVGRRPLVRVAPDDSVEAVARRMLDDGVRHALVMERDSVVGVVSMRDLMAAYTPGAPRDRGSGRPSGR
jgi:CBS domain-containing protein